MAHLFNANGASSLWSQKGTNLKALFFGKKAAPSGGKADSKSTAWRRNLWVKSDVLKGDVLTSSEAASVRNICMALADEIEDGLNPGVKGWQVEEVMRELPHVARCLLRIDDSAMRMQIERRLMPRDAVDRFDALVLKIKRSEREVMSECKDCASARGAKKLTTGPNLNQASRLFEPTSASLGVARDRPQTGGERPKTGAPPAKQSKSPRTSKSPRSPPVKSKVGKLSTTSLPSLRKPEVSNSSETLAPPTIGALFRMASWGRMTDEGGAPPSLSGQPSIDLPPPLSRHQSTEFDSLRQEPARPRFPSTTSVASADRSRHGASLDGSGFAASLDRSGHGTSVGGGAFDSAPDVFERSVSTGSVKSGALTERGSKPPPKCRKCSERDSANKGMLELVKGGVIGKAGGFVANCFCCASEFSRLAVAGQIMTGKKKDVVATCRFCESPLIKGKDDQCVSSPAKAPTMSEKAAAVTGEMVRGLAERAAARGIPTFNDSSDGTSSQVNVKKIPVVPLLSLPRVGAAAGGGGRAMTVR